MGQRSIPELQQLAYLAMQETGDLSHHGVKGMKWGVRRSQAELGREAGRRPDGVSRRTNRAAKKDAKEHARAAAFYGQGAGTRRKLIRNKVESQAKKDASYKKAFDYHRERQDMGKHQSKATRERRRKDVVGGTAKTARGVHRSLTGGFGSVTLMSATLAAAYVYSKKTGMDKVVMSHAKTKVSDARKYVDNMSRAKKERDLFKKMGINLSDLKPQ